MKRLIVFSLLLIASTAAAQVDSVVIKFHDGSSQTLVATPATQPTISAKLAGLAIGTPGSWANSSATFDKAFDGRLDTFFDAPTGNGVYAGVALSNPSIVTMIRFAPRAERPDRMVGGVFKASNDQKEWTTLYAVTSAPPVGKFTEVPINNATPFRFVYYFAPDNSFGNIAEIEVWGIGPQAAVIPPLEPVPADVVHIDSAQDLSKTSTAKVAALKRGVIFDITDSLHIGSSQRLTSYGDTSLPSPVIHWNRTDAPYGACLFISGNGSQVDSLAIDAGNAAGIQLDKNDSTILRSLKFLQAEDCIKLFGASKVRIWDCEGPPKGLQNGYFGFLQSSQVADCDQIEFKRNKGYDSTTQHQIRGEANNLEIADNEFTLENVKHNCFAIQRGKNIWIHDNIIHKSNISIGPNPAPLPASPGVGQPDSYFVDGVRIENIRFDGGQIQIYGNSSNVSLANITGTTLQGEPLIQVGHGDARDLMANGQMRIVDGLTIFNSATTPYSITPGMVKNLVTK
jgi:hypothetical protein